MQTKLKEQQRMKTSYYSSWNKVVTKMPCGRKVYIPFYGTLRAYKTKSGRRFALSKSYNMPSCGNMSLETVRYGLKAMAYSLESRIISFA